jgi:type I restriction enzyme R subunit
MAPGLQVIHNAIRTPWSREFKNDNDFRIAISVDMLDTGIDITGSGQPSVRQAGQSWVKFWQMIGRGTLCAPICSVPVRTNRF